MVLGPFSLQGEYFHAFTGASEVGNPRFWGVYLQASYFLTGEHRTYDAANGIFSQIKPKNDEFVKSHIPYVVHASTKPVLSEPSTLRPFDRLTAQGERWVEALSTNGISIGYPALRGIHPEP